jgi:DNA-binding YbaB/EbfC family protein
MPRLTGKGSFDRVSVRFANGNSAQDDRRSRHLHSINTPTNERQLMGGFNLQDLMSKAKSQYETLQKKMQETVVEASSGGGTVTAKMDGRKQLLSLRIDPEAVKSGDVEMLQDLILAAVNEAARKIDAALQSSLGGMLGGLGIPGL